MLNLMSWLVRIPKIAVTALMILAMLNMLAGVFLRYVMTQVSVAFNLPSVSFYWVEELGELSLIWLTFIGAGLGIFYGQHFAVQVVSERVSPGWQRLLAALSYCSAIVFGAVVAYYAPQVAARSALSVSPALRINMAWLFHSALVGGVLLVIYGLAAMVKLFRTRPSGVVAGFETSPHDGNGELPFASGAGSEARRYGENAELATSTGGTES